MLQCIPHLCNRTLGLIVCCDTALREIVNPASVNQYVFNIVMFTFDGPLLLCLVTNVCDVVATNEAQSM